MSSHGFIRFSKPRRTHRNPPRRAHAPAEPHRPHWPGTNLFPKINRLSILWGPPGTGKTSFANALSKQLDFRFVSENAVDFGTKDIKDLGKTAEQRRRELQEQTVLFIDEIHRLNKSQQDVLLPFIEKGDFILIGATTENPSYSLNRALVSRCQVLVFERLNQKALKTLLERGCSKNKVDPRHLFSETSLEDLLQYSDGDARKLFNALELIFDTHAENPTIFPLDSEALKKTLGYQFLPHDKNSENHYDLISAFIKSVRGTDPDAAIYYLARMLKGGEDPNFIARRLIILASEDIGNGDPRALGIAVQAAQALEMIGLPEGAITLAQATTYLATAPKSNRSYMALNRAKEIVDATGALPVPLKLRSSKTELSRSLNYGKDYLYPHNETKSWAPQDYLPESIRNEKFYEPADNGYEKHIRQFLKFLKGTSQNGL